jgi:hypothetical protein
MAEEIGQLTVRVTADTTQLTSSLDKAKRQAEAFAGTTGKATTAVGQFNRTLTLSATGANSVASSFSKVGQAVQPLQQHFTNVTASLTNMVKGFAALATAQAALNLAKAFADQQRQIALLSAQFKLLGVDSGKAMQDLADFNDELQRTTGLDDDVIRAAESIGLRFGLLGNDLKQVTKLAADFAVIAGEDLPQAMLTISRITDEPVQALTRLKRVLPIDSETERLVKAFDKVGDRSSAANTLLNALRQQLTGLAHDTDTGVTKSMRDFNNALDDLGKTLAGSFVGPRMVAFIDEFNKRIATTGKEITRIVDAIQAVEDFFNGPQPKPIKLFEDQPQTVEELAAALEKIHQQRLAEHPIKLNLPPSEDTAALKAATDAATKYRDALERVSFERDTLWLSPAAKAAATAAQDAFGPTWKAHLDDAIALQAKFNEELSQSYDLTRDFAGTFVHDLLQGKSAIESITDALGRLEDKLVDMALDNVVKGLFSMLSSGATGGNLFTSLLSGGGVGNSAASGGVFATGGVVGSTPVPTLAEHGKLKYDEFPAILHVGERVIPVSGQKPQMSGRDMIRMFGGVPKFEGGWQPMLGAGSSGGAGYVFTPGGTGGGGGGPSQTMDIGGTLSYPKWSSGTGGGNISLPSSSRGGGTISVPRFAGYPISPPVAPRERIIGIPLPSPFTTYDPALENPFDPFAPLPGPAVWPRLSVFPGPPVALPSFPFPKPPAYVPDFGLIRTPPLGGYYPEFDRSTFVPRAGSHTMPSRSLTRSLPTPDDSGPSGGSTVGDIGQPYGGAGGVTPYFGGFGGAYHKQRGFHTGGYVGSTPGKPVRGLLGELFRHAPRLHAGLAADEYPAVLQAGERVIPRGGESSSAKVTVVINNNVVGAQVTTSETSDNMGGLRLDIAIDQLVSAKMRDGGSQISRALDQRGARATPLRR